MSWNPRQLDPEWPFEITETSFALDTASSALLVIDMQTSDVTMANDALLAQKYPAIEHYWNQRMTQIVIPALKKLVDIFRNHDRPVIYTRNGPWTTTAAEMAPRLRNKLAQVPSFSRRGSDGYGIIPELAPAFDDIVIDKLTSGAFTASSLDHILRNLQVTHLIVGGILTDMCVSGTARTAAELGYYTTICEDGCATLTARAHDEALLMHARTFGQVQSTEQIVHLFSGDQK